MSLYDLCIFLYSSWFSPSGSKTVKAFKEEIIINGFKEYKMTAFRQIYNQQYQQKPRE